MWSQPRGALLTGSHWKNVITSKTCQNESLKNVNSPRDTVEQASGHLFRASACVGTMGTDSLPLADEDHGLASADSSRAARPDVRSLPLLPGGPGLRLGGQWQWQLAWQGTRSLLYLPSVDADWPSSAEAHGVQRCECGDVTVRVCVSPTLAPSPAAFPHKAYT